MAKGFTLEINPWVYLAKYSDTTETGKNWRGGFRLKPHLNADEEKKISAEERDKILASRNSYPDLPLVNYTTQYGFGVFEGLKAFPQKDGTLRAFRPDENGKRMANSMQGLGLPPYPPKAFVKTALELVARNRDLGFTPRYDPQWEKNSFVTGHSVYIRPFAYAEPGIGLNLPQDPWVAMVTTTVGAYFQPGNSKAVVTDKVRAYPGGTGWIKCNANYVTPILVKKAAIAAGYMEAVFLDAKRQRYFEEGSSCNIFFYMKDGVLATPELGDTILPGITRKSILQLAESQGVKTVERKIELEEAFDSAQEVFVTGTAAGVSFIESLTHNGRTVVFGDGTMGELTKQLLVLLKGIQYGAVEDRFGWMFDCG